jgi:hypothetical protein
LKTIFDNYFSVKDALVKTDAGNSSTKAAELVKAIKAIEMVKLSTEEHTVWMKVMKDLTSNTEKIAASKNVAQQKEAFALLSKNMYELAKASKQEILYIISIARCIITGRSKLAEQGRSD